MNGGRPMVAAALVAILAAACSGPILANPPAVVVAPPAPSPGASRLPDPQPIAFPRDDGPHDRLTEWWYYTGHLADAAGGHWGFEFVIFRAERGGFPVTWASHLAITNEVVGTFDYDQRSAIGPSVDQSGNDGRAFGFGLLDPALPVFTTSTPQPSVEAGTLISRTWAMAGDSGSAFLVASMAEGTYGLELQTDAVGRGAVLHGGNGWIDFGPAGGSYYYSRPRLAVVGNLAAGGRAHAVSGSAWFDHQWGDFISVGGGGWDWFAVNLDDGTDLTISRVRAADGTYPLVYGTLVDRAGATRNLAATDFTAVADPERSWTSPTTGAVYPAAWTIQIPGEDLVVSLQPTVANQELDTRPTTGVAYWEGSQTVTATRAGRALGGEAYVELTGYAPAKP